jgi:pyrroloquinoline-quinone synthase
LITTFHDLCLKKDEASGLAALYAYESQIPSICISKIEGLKKHYGIHNQEDFKYFIVHIEADEKHAFVERELLAKHLDKKNLESTKEAATKVLDALNAFLSSLSHRFNLATCI